MPSEALDTPPRVRFFIAILNGDGFLHIAANNRPLRNADRTGPTSAIAPENAAIRLEANHQLTAAQIHVNAPPPGSFIRKVQSLA